MHVGVPEVDFPVPDPSVFQDYATTIVDEKTKTTGNTTFTNILIRAGTNPSFVGQIVLQYDAEHYDEGEGS